MDDLPLGETIDFLRLVWAVDHALQRRSKLMERAVGLTGPQRLLIRIVGRYPGIHAKQLAAILHLHPSSLTALIGKLERRGVVMRRVDGRDRRRWQLGLTKRGRLMNRDAPETIESAVRCMLQTVPAGHLQGARIVLAALTRILDETPVRGVAGGRAAAR